MVGTIRTVVALLFLSFSTLLLSPLVWIGLKTGLFPVRSLLWRWHRSVAFALGVRIRVQGAASTARPLLIAANHVSWTDIIALGATADVSFIAKSQMSAWPLIGWLASLQRTLFIERERKQRSSDQANEIAARLAEGDAMVLFAEGTTGEGHVVMPFKSSLFAAARLTTELGANEGVLVQPVAIAYTRLHGMPIGRLQRKHTSWTGDQSLAPHALTLLRNGGVDVTICFGEPTLFAPDDSRKVLARQLEGEVRDMLRGELAGRAS